ncbi:ComEC/Rec2 family competence protein [Helicobacter suis]|uniref:Competence locus E n=2 Tax=Helicobacter suis TaxID=104628 RepID=E7G373_9HELI|nr:ComEC/Rec2 family competence protein [Helicobacter suis]EFX42186.1 competence locus E [Helicobacter suis HS5]EFX43377.1 competence locus E [Helicobacter suis HS1]BCD47075.1 Competence locus E ComE 3 [Helicobacter suis]BCD48832.1 Competence locus E ComE 3 [Helicobacter suis]BCD50611.1 Competence locus E ComE 3 [Helicobacter suis]
MPPVTLFQTPKEWIYALGLLLGLFAISLSLKYQQYSRFLDKKPLSLHAQVLLQYNKGATQVLKLQDSHYNVFYTTSKEDIKDLSLQFVRAFGKMAPCSFWQFLKSCYFYTFSLSLEQGSDPKNPLRKAIDTQHNSPLMGNFYRTLFLADLLDQSLRQVVVGLGLSHLIAISGFHLGILSAFFFLILKYPYTFLQQRYFPYRNRAYDLMGVVLCLLLGYLFLLHFQPSFLRAFVMALLGFFLLYNGLELLSFSLLALVVLLSLILFPSLVRNIGFILSVGGVFYIFLFIKHMPKLHPLIYAFLLNTTLFLHMLPLVHAFFAPFNPYQLSGILLSFIFVLFFPLSLILHLFNSGDLFDPYLLQTLKWHIPTINYHTPIWLLSLYGFFSLLAIRFVYAYYALYVISLALFFYLLIS